MILSNTMYPIISKEYFKNCLSFNINNITVTIVQIRYNIMKHYLFQNGDFKNHNETCFPGKIQIKTE